MIDLTAYANVIVDVGVALKRGQNLLIVCNEGNQDLGRAVAKAAYERGAGYVDLRVDDIQVTRARLENQTGDQLRFLPGWAPVSAMT